MSSTAKGISATYEFAPCNLAIQLFEVFEISTKRISKGSENEGFEISTKRISKGSENGEVKFEGLPGQSYELKIKGPDCQVWEETHKVCIPGIV